MWTNKNSPFKFRSWKWTVNRNQDSPALQIPLSLHAASLIPIMPHCHFRLSEVFLFHEQIIYVERYLSTSYVGENSLKIFLDVVEMKCQQIAHAVR
jgi:hypothetical protein